MSIIIHGGTIDATKIAVPRSQGGWSLEALARYIPPTLVAKVLKRTGRSGQRHRQWCGWSLPLVCGGIVIFQRSGVR